MATKQAVKVEVAVVKNGQPMVKMVELEEIVASRTNPRKRFDEAAMKELTASIKDKGLVSPLLVRPLPGLANGALYELVAGERRFRACTSLGIDRVPALVRELTDQQALELQIIENLQRDDLDPLEEAEGYEKLMASGEYSALDLAVKVNKTRVYIYQRLKLLFLPEAARQALLEGKLNLFKARTIGCLPHQDWREEATRIVLSPKKCKAPDLDDSDYWDMADGEVLSDRQVTELVAKRYMRGLKNAPFDQKDPELNPEQGPCSTCPKRAGNSKELFPDLHVDTCTDPKCYALKVERTLEADAAKQGARVLPESEREKVFCGPGLRYNSPYVELESELSYSDVAPGVKPPKWKTLLKGLGVPVHLAVDEEGNKHQLVDHKLALEAAKEAVKEKKIADIFRKRGASAGSESDRKEAEKRKRDAEIEAAVFVDTMAALQAKIEKEVDGARFATAFLKYAFSVDQNNGGVIETVCKRRRIEPKKDDDFDGAMVEHVKKLATPEAKLALAVEILLTIDEDEMYGGMADDPEIFLEAYKIDRKKIEAETRANFVHRQRQAKVPFTALLGVAGDDGVGNPAQIGQGVSAVLFALKPSADSDSKAAGALGERIVRELQAVGASGITVKDLSAKCDAKPGAVFSWFYTTGKKVAGVIKVGEAKYGFREKAVAK